jgi:putative RNA 2'-phosphotransferase
MSGHQASTWLSWALRHDPQAAGIVLDEAGWTAVPALLAAAAAAGHALDRDRLAALVAASDKQRFALSPDGLRIRANQGHSVPVALGLAAQAPPAVLFHGTAERFLGAIRRAGLERRARHHVHLSTEPATADAVGGRHGRPVVLRVDAARMHADGHVFRCSANGVWLVDAVPPQYLEVHHA